MAYEYHYTQREASFGPPAATEMAGGAHLTFDVMPHVGGVLYALRRPAAVLASGSSGW